MLNAQSNKSQLTFKEFQASLKKEMDYNALVDAFGKPNEDIGSGIYVYVYSLTDSTRILIGYTDKIIYARHIDQEYNVLNTLIE